MCVQAINQTKLLFVCCLFSSRHYFNPTSVLTGSGQHGVCYLNVCLPRSSAFCICVAKIKCLRSFTPKPCMLLLEEKGVHTEIA